MLQQTIPHEYRIAKDPYKKYQVVQHSDNDFDVWYEGLRDPYRVTFNPETCGCPHWTNRLKKPGLRCKHHDIVEDRVKKGKYI